MEIQDLMDQVGPKKVSFVAKSMPTQFTYEAAYALMAAHVGLPD
jgi:hypothetical protein